jgi:hypothetical protein
MPILAGTLAALFCVAVAGGYGLGWSWTGFADNDTLWDWLQLFVLPVSVTLAPLWYRTRGRLAMEWRGLGIAAAVAAAVLLLGGYQLGWTWTGFAGKPLWDWLELLVLPAVLVALPILLTEGHDDTRWRLGLAVLAPAFAGCALGGYLLDWDWTGFEGNTLWDWLHLFLVPFALPAALIWFGFSERESH